MWPARAASLRPASARPPALKQYLEAPDEYDTVLAGLLPRNLVEEARKEQRRRAYEAGRNPTAADDWGVYEGRLAERRQRPLLGLPTGLPGLDRALGGLRGLTFLGGGPGVGKTSLALALAVNALRAAPDVAVLFYSLDMSKTVLFDRLLCQEAGIPYPALLEKDWSEGDRARVLEATARLREEILPRLRFAERLAADPGGASVALAVRTALHDLVLNTGARRLLTVLDYFQLMPVPEDVSTALDADHHRVAALQWVQEWTRTEESPTGDPILEAPPEQRPELLDHFARAAGDFDLPGSFASARPGLRPVVEPRWCYADWRGADGREADSEYQALPPWFLPVGEHLAVGLAYHTPDRVLCACDPFLAGWGVTEEEAFAAACDNLRRQSARPFTSPARGVFASDWGDDADAARLALTDLIRDLEVRGDYVAMAPNRDTLLVTGSEDEAGLAAVLELAEQAVRRPYSISGIPVRLAQGRWQDFAPEQRFPRLSGYRALRLQAEGEAYTQQQKALNVLLPQRGEDVFVASCLLMGELRKESGRPFTSCCVWTEGLCTLLPRTGAVSLCRPNGPDDAEILAVANWDHVREVAGDLMTPVGTYPERYRVEQFPTAAQLREIGFDPMFERLRRAS